MRALQRELGLVVVERLEAQPCGFAMTIVAGLSETPLMRINRLVTIEAASRRVAKLDAHQVTAVALYRLVSVPKQEIRELVIECLAVEEEDVCVSPLVIGVTMVAFLFRCFWLTPMKSAGLLTIGRRLLVTVQTQSRL